MKQFGKNASLCCIDLLCVMAAGASNEPMECICFSKDTGKTTSPTGHWEVQTFAHNKDWLVCPIFWLAMWFVPKYEAAGWKV